MESDGDFKMFSVIEAAGYFLDCLDSKINPSALLTWGI